MEEVVRAVDVNRDVLLVMVERAANVIVVGRLVMVVGRVVGRGRRETEAEKDGGEEMAAVERVDDDIIIDDEE